METQNSWATNRLTSTAGIHSRRSTLTSDVQIWISVPLGRRQRDTKTRNVAGSHSLWIGVAGNLAMNGYMRSSKQSANMTELIGSDSRYHGITERCDDLAHYDSLVESMPCSPWMEEFGISRGIILHTCITGLSAWKCCSEVQKRRASVLYHSFRFFPVLYLFGTGCDIGTVRQMMEHQTVALRCCACRHSTGISGSFGVHLMVFRPR